MAFLTDERLKFGWNSPGTLAASFFLALTNPFPRNPELLFGYKCWQLVSDRGETRMKFQGTVNFGPLTDQQVSRLFLTCLKCPTLNNGCKGIIPQDGMAGAYSCLDLRGDFSHARCGIGKRIEVAIKHKINEK